MSTATQCGCCRETFDPTQPHGEDVDLGLMCLDCAMGVCNGLKVLARAGVRGILRSRRRAGGHAPDKGGEGQP